MTPPSDTLTYRIAEVARLLGIGRNSAYEAAKRGDIPSIRIGKRLLVPRAALHRQLDGDGHKPDKNTGVEKPHKTQTAAAKTPEAVDRIVERGNE